jgi:hypothetical protein
MYKTVIEEMMMLKEPLGGCGRRNFIQSLLIALFVLSSIGMAQAQNSAPATGAIESVGRLRRKQSTLSPIFIPITIGTHGS